MLFRLIVYPVGLVAITVSVCAFITGSQKMLQAGMVLTMITLILSTVLPDTRRRRWRRRTVDLPRQSH